jgi:nicotinate phosphoribosyltransferase
MPARGRIAAMSFLSTVYRTSLGLLTDLYELTMAYGYWQEGMRQTEACFHLFFRRHPFKGGFTLACGLAQAVEFLEALRFAEDDLAYLASLAGSDGRPFFDRGFLDHLRSFAFACDVDAMPEGTVVFPGEPLVRVKGPILQAQLLETALLTLINFQTLIATKAARVCLAAQGEAVLEFGLRRAQGIDGGLSASRAAYVGGCAATSNVLAGKLFGIPVKGTHAHSWVMAFATEEEAFDAWARAMPNNAVFLVDTYDSLDGVRRAAEVGKRLRQQGQKFLGVRLDSGDLAYLSIEARRILDEAGFPEAQVLASSELDEYIVESLKRQGARVAVWGVGTKLVTAFDEPALGGVYKLAAVREPGGSWRQKVKLSEQAIKTSTPGIQQVRRFAAGPEFVADALYDETLGIPATPTIIDPLDMTRRKHLGAGLAWEDLLVPVFRAGRRVLPVAPLEEARRRAQAQLAGFHAGIKRFVNPHQYPVGLEERLFDAKTRLVLAARGEVA